MTLEPSKSSDSTDNYPKTEMLKTPVTPSVVTQKKCRKAEVNKMDIYVVKSNKEVKIEVEANKIDTKVKNMISSPKNANKIPEKNKNQAEVPPKSFKDISSFFHRTDRQNLITDSSSNSSSAKSGSTTVHKILSMGSRRSKNSTQKNKIERGLQGQRPISVFLRESNKSKDIALGTPGKRKFTEIQSIFDPKKCKGDLYDCTPAQPYSGKPVPGDKVTGDRAGAS